MEELFEITYGIDAGNYPCAANFHVDVVVSDLDPGMDIEHYIDTLIEENFRTMVFPYCKNRNEVKAWIEEKLKEMPNE